MCQIEKSDILPIGESSDLQTAQKKDFSQKTGKQQLQYIDITVKRITAVLSIDYLC